MRRLIHRCYDLGLKIRSIEMLSQTNIPRHKVNRAFALLVAFLMLSGLVVLLASLGSVSPPTALVKSTGWKVSGAFTKLSESVDSMQVPRGLSSDSNFMMFRSWTPAGGAKGQVESAPFMPPRYLAVPYIRGDLRVFDEPDEIKLTCTASSAEMIVSSAPTFDEWVIAYLEIPATFCDSSVCLIASARGHSATSYLGIA